MHCITSPLPFLSLHFTVHCIQLSVCVCVCVLCMCAYYSIYQHKQSICGALNHTSLLCFRFIRCLKTRLCEKVQHVRSTPIGTFSAVKTTEIRTSDMRCEPYRQFNSLTECVGMLPPSINLFYISSGELSPAFLSFHQ